MDNQGSPGTCAIEGSVYEIVTTTELALSGPEVEATLMVTGAEQVVAADPTFGRPRRASRAKLQTVVSVVPVVQEFREQ